MNEWLWSTPLNDSLAITSPQAAAVFQRPRSRRIVLELVGEARSLAELAAATGLSLTLLHYHVSRMLALGLVEVTAFEGRSGRAVKRYRAVARAFFVPSHLSTDVANTALARELRDGLERDRARLDDAGVTFFVDEAGKPRMVRTGGGGRGQLELWARLSLTPLRAEALARDIKALFAAYGETSDGLRFLAYCAFTEETR